MDTITEREISNHGNYYGELQSMRIIAIPEKKGALALEFLAGGNGYAESRHLVLTDVQQALKLSAQIRRTLLPELEHEVLESLGRMEKKLDELS